MHARGVRRNRGEEEEESYFISMADMMVGLLFIFVILLLYFALQFRQTTDTLTGADNTRSQILKSIKDELAKQGLKVEIDTKTGVLRLRGDVLFASADADLSPEGRKQVALVAQAMAKVLPCYTYGVSQAGCRPSPHRIDAVFVEGHTDKDTMRAGGDNLDLSVRRAANTYRQLVASSDRLLRMYDHTPAEGRPSRILSVSGYGPDRPVADGDSEAAKSRNRRIDLRFLMATPRTREIDAMSRILVGRR